MGETVGDKVATEKVNEAIEQAKEDARTLQGLIIAGHLQPQELSTALDLLQRQSLTNIELLAVVGEDKFVTKAQLRPWVASFLFIAGSAVTAFFTYVNGKLG